MASQNHVNRRIPRATLILLERVLQSGKAQERWKELTSLEKKYQRLINEYVFFLR